MSTYYQEHTLEYCIQTVMRMEDPRFPQGQKSICALDLLYNLPTDDPALDIDREMRETQHVLAKGNLSAQELRYLRAKYKVLSIMMSL